jgi:hypothetical protein
LPNCALDGSIMISLFFKTRNEGEVILRSGLVLGTRFNFLFCCTWRSYFDFGELHYNLKSWFVNTVGLYEE